MLDDQERGIVDLALTHYAEHLYLSAHSQEEQEVMAEQIRALAEKIKDEGAMKHRVISEWLLGLERILEHPRPLTPEGTPAHSLDFDQGHLYAWLTIATVYFNQYLDAETRNRCDELFRHILSQTS